MGYAPREDTHLQRTSAEGVGHEGYTVVAFCAQLQVRLVALILHGYAFNSGTFERIKTEKEREAVQRFHDSVVHVQHVVCDTGFGCGLPPKIDFEAQLA